MGITVGPYGDVDLGDEACTMHECLLCGEQWEQDTIDPEAETIVRLLGMGVEMNPTNFPQFFNPENHLPTCDNPDKLFRFCECPR